MRLMAVLLHSHRGGHEQLLTAITHAEVARREAPVESMSVVRIVVVSCVLVMELALFLLCLLLMWLGLSLGDDCFHVQYTLA